LGWANAWHPFLIGMTKANGHAAEGLGMLLSEWQNFVGHRLQQDLMLWRMLAGCTTPQDVAAAYTEFWQKAVADYWQEYATMSKLVTGITAKLPMQAQTASLEAAQPATSIKAA
jgi:hypothetical protein